MKSLLVLTTLRGSIYASSSRDSVRNAANMLLVRLTTLHVQVYYIKNEQQWYLCCTDRLFLRWRCLWRLESSRWDKRRIWRRRGLTRAVIRLDSPVVPLQSQGARPLTGGETCWRKLVMIAVSRVLHHGYCRRSHWVARWNFGYCVAVLWHRMYT